jgi:hypothetical protein
MFRPSDFPTCFPSIPFVFTRFRTLLHSPKTQLFCFQSLPHSLLKTPGVGVRRITRYGPGAWLTKRTGRIPDTVS